MGCFERVSGVSLEVYSKCYERLRLAMLFVPITRIQQLGGHVLGVSFLAVLPRANVRSHAEVADLHHAFVGHLIVRDKGCVVVLI